MAHNAQVINKAKIWLGITYPENMADGWQDNVSDILQGIPYAYCIHDADPGSEDGDERKEHVHWILYLKDILEGTTTRKHATNILDMLSAPGRHCAIPCEACVNIEHAWNYLIHDTESAQKAGKKLYPKEARITGNTFDIDRYKVLSTEQKHKMLQELCDFVHERKIMDLDTLYGHVQVDFPENYFEIFLGNNSLLDRLCRGVYNKRERKRASVEMPGCAICGNKEILGRYETKDGSLWYCTNCQEIAYNYLVQLEESGEEDVLLTD